jgi:hypothetical protein
MASVALIYRDRGTTTLPSTPPTTVDEDALKDELTNLGYTVTTYYSGKVSGGNWGSGDGAKSRTEQSFTTFDFIVCCWDSEYIDWCSYCASPCSCPTHCSSPAKSACIICSPD